MGFLKRQNESDKVKIEALEKFKSKTSDYLNRFSKRFDYYSQIEELRKQVKTICSFSKKNSISVVLKEYDNFGFSCDFSDEMEKETVRNRKRVLECQNFIESCFREYKESLEKYINDHKKEDIDQMEIDTLNAKAHDIVNIAVTAAVAAAAVPIPFADAPMLITDQVAMMGKISSLYKIDIKKSGLKTLAMAAIGAGGATVVGKAIVTSVMKFFPGIGSIGGGVIASGTAGIVTLAMGNAFITLCEKIKKGEIDEGFIYTKDFVSQFKELFKKELKRTKEEDVKEATMEQTSEKPENIDNQPS